MLFLKLSKQFYEGRLQNVLKNNALNIVTTNVPKKYFTKLKYNAKKYLEFNKEVYEVIPMNVRLPRIYDLPTIHKEHVSIRFIVCFSSSYAYKLFSVFKYS